MLIYHEDDGEGRRRTPSDMNPVESLVALKTNAEVFFGGEVTGAVIVTPTDLMNVRYMKDICDAAGLNVLRFMNPGSALALAYAFKTRLKEGTVGLVFDWGASTLHVTVVRFQDSTYDIKACSGKRSGGHDLTQALVRHIVNDFEQIHGIYLRHDRTAMRRIAEASETAKCALSTTHSATVDLRSLRNDIDYRAVIDRELADSLWTDLFALALGHVDDAVNAADIQDVDIDNVILAGGSTRSLAIQRLLKERFPHAQHDRSMDNGESAAYGAAIQASALAHDCTESLGIEVIIDDALPAAIGIEVQGGFMATILARNAPIPSYRSQIFTNHMDKQTEVRLPVYQGDANLARDCELIGILSLSGLASVDRGLSRIEVSILLDQDHSPEIVATDLATGYSTTLVVLKDHRLHWTDVPLIPDIRGMEVILA